MLALVLLLKAADGVRPDGSRSRYITADELRAAFHRSVTPAQEDDIGIKGELEDGLRRARAWGLNLGELQFKDGGDGPQVFLPSDLAMRVARDHGAEMFRYRAGGSVVGVRPIDAVLRPGPAGALPSPPTGRRGRNRYTAP